MRTHALASSLMTEDKVHAAYEAMLHAGSMLAYDVTIRTADPSGTSHQPASKPLTELLKANYIRAYEAYMAAQAAQEKR